MSGVDYWDLQGINPYLYTFSDESQIVATLIECESNYYRDENGLCTLCTRCFEPYETEIKPCTNSSNRVCKSILDVDLTILGSAGIDVDKLNQTALKEILYNQFNYNFPNYSVNGQILNVLNVVATPKLCPPTAYLDVETLLCVACAGLAILPPFDCSQTPSPR
jgi:hypothetical protein